MNTVSAYLDTNIVSCLVKGQLDEDEVDAMRELLRMPEVRLCTSRKMADELAGIPPKHRAPHSRIYESLEKVCFVADSFQAQPTLNTGQARLVGPLPVAEVVEIQELLRGKLNRRRADAQHLHQALEAGIDYFVTLDVKTILKARDVIEAKYGIRLRRPSELLRDLPASP